MEFEILFGTPHGGKWRKMGVFVESVGQEGAVFQTRTICAVSQVSPSTHALRPVEYPRILVLYCGSEHRNNSDQQGIQKQISLCAFPGQGYFI